MVVKRVNRIKDVVSIISSDLLKKGNIIINSTSNSKKMRATKKNRSLKFNRNSL